ncbi:hypothetical protein SAMN05444266_108182 [Chitinophaga jiangningensis]|uniref:Uncharacterized protein n=1 Tax=Chitinophaga jiangningensis TaxID=1419482 RepID=A0A1M7J162_9BACT|nr:hypothetical protein [Chitinophaga jiangningensis]SHM46804.1 hypothetical protein SAMN05444266_108182 [Chitinophaga jiangningensis]
MLFSIVLLIHFVAFALYLAYLGALWPTRGAGPRSKMSLYLGIILLVTGVVLVCLKYPHVNYYKVIPKTAAFLGVTGINIRFGERDLTKGAYYWLMGLAIGAGVVAVWH